MSKLQNMGRRDKSARDMVSFKDNATGSQELLAIEEG